MHQLLLVDDQTILADDLAKMLPWRDIGIREVYTAYSAREALELMKEYTIDIVVTDIRMPEMSGLELIAAIHQSSKHIKCILLTGYSDFEYARQAIQLHSTDYLLKPVADEELLHAVKKAIAELDGEWEKISSMQRAQQSLREHIPKLREYLLNDILAGNPYTSGQLQYKLDTYSVPIRPDDDFYLMLIRIDDTTEANRQSNELMEYALTNIATEIFSDEFHLWCCKDSHGYIACLLSVKAKSETFAAKQWDEAIERCALEFQHCAKTYLKLVISVLTSKRGIFPQDAAAIYHASILDFQHFIGSDRDLVLSLIHKVDRGQPQLLNHLYRTPTLLQLLEIGQWEEVEAKLAGIFAELAENLSESQEHLLEAYLMIAGSFASIVHKNKRWIYDSFGELFYALNGGEQLRSVEQLRDWSAQMLASFKKLMNEEEQDSRSLIVRQVQDYISHNLKQATLQSIASQVYLNPSYLSKIYKLETGEGISEYMFRLRMENAADLLAHSNDKIYEISLTLGYQKTSYFIQLFKKQYGMTPQEYRDKLV